MFKLTSILPYHRGLGPVPNVCKWVYESDPRRWKGMIRECRLASWCIKASLRRAGSDHRPNPECLSSSPTPLTLSHVLWPLRRREGEGFLPSQRRIAEVRGLLRITMVGVDRWCSSKKGNDVELNRCSDLSTTGATSAGGGRSQGATSTVGRGPVDREDE